MNSWTITDLDLRPHAPEILTSTWPDPLSSVAG